MKIKTYSRKEYLTWCKEKGVKKPLSEHIRNPFTICGYPIIRPLGTIVEECDSDEWYKNHW